MHKTIEGIEQKLTAARQRMTQLQSDRRYSQEERNRQATEHWQAERAAAQKAFDLAVVNANLDVESAQYDLSRAHTAWRNSQDPARQSVAHMEAQVLAQTASTVDELTAAAEAARVAGDDYALRSLHKIALPTIMNRAGNSDDRGRYNALRNEIGRHLDTLVPEGVKAAQTAVETAQANQRSLHTDARRLNERATMFSGGHPPLDTGEKGFFTPSAPVAVAAD